MKKDNFIYIEDMLDACERILSYASGMSRETLNEDRLTQDAIIRNITIIGEAVGKLTKEFTDENPEIPAREAITMRNKLVHDYAFIDSDILWDTISKDIPDLLSIIKKIKK